MYTNKTPDMTVIAINIKVFQNLATLLFIIEVSTPEPRESRILKKGKFCMKSIICPPFSA
jgi:hypothetical protein